MDTNEPKVQVFIILDSGFVIERSIYDARCAEIIKVIPNLLPDSKYPYKSLCGRDLWNSRSDWENQLGGMCIAYAVRHRKLPLRFAGKQCQSPKLYSLP